MARPNPMDSSGSDASWIYIVGTDVDGIPGASSAQGAGTTDIDDNPGALSAQSAGTPDIDDNPGASSAQGAGTTDIDDNTGALSAQSVAANVDESLGVPDVATAVKLIEEKLAEMVARVKQQLPEGRVPNPMASTSSEQTSGTSEDMLSNLQEALADDAVGAGAAAAPSAGTSWAQSAATVSGGVFNTAPPCAYNKSSVPFSRVDKQ